MAQPEDSTSAGEPATSDEEDVLHRIVREGPAGTWAVAGVATALVVLIYVLFYFIVYLPRGAVQ